MGRAEQKSPAPRRLAVVAAIAAGLGLAAAGCSAGQITQTDTQVAVVNGASGQAGAIAVRDAQLLFPVADGHYAEGDDAPLVVTIANNGPEQDKLLAVTSEASGEAELTGDVELEPGSAVVSGADQDGLGSHSSTSATATGTTGTGTGTTGTTSASASGSPVTTTTTASSRTAGTTGSPAPTSANGSSISNPPTTTRKIPSSVDPTEAGVLKVVLKGMTRELRPGQTIKVTFLFEKGGPVTLDLPIGASPKPREDGASEH